MSLVVLLKLFLLWLFIAVAAPSLPRVTLTCFVPHLPIGEAHTKHSVPMTKVVADEERLRVVLQPTRHGPQHPVVVLESQQSWCL